MALAKTRVRYVGGASTIPLLLGIGTIAVCSVNWPFRNSPTPIQSCFKNSDLFSSVRRNVTPPMVIFEYPLMASFFKHFTTLFVS